MNVLKSGGHSSYCRAMSFGYVVVQYIAPKLYCQQFFIYLLVWPHKGPKVAHFGPQYQARLYPPFVRRIVSLKLIKCQEIIHATNFCFLLSGGFISTKFGAVKLCMTCQTRKTEARDLRRELQLRQQKLQASKTLKHTRFLH